MRGRIIGVFLMSVIFSCGKPAEVKQKLIETDSSESNNLAVFLNHYEHIFKLNLGVTGCPGAAVAIVKDTSVIFMKGFGEKELGKNDPVTENTVFRIGSISKGFASVLTAMLVDKKILSWEDRIVDHVPYFELRDTAQTRRLRIKHILSHTTGLPSQSLSSLIEDGEPLPDMIVKLKKLKPDTVEGTSFAYQNVAYSIIQEVVVSKTGKEYNEWITEIFKKAGMKNASITYDGLMNTADKSMPHIQKKNDNWEVKPIHDKYFNVPAAAGVNASISDMAQWLKVIMGNKPEVIPKKSLEFIHTPYIVHDSLNYFQQWVGISSAGYGMGFMIMQYQGHKIVWHSGTLNDFKSLIAFDPEEQIGICILFNAIVPYYKIAIPEFFEMYYMYKEMEVQSLKHEGKNEI